MTPPPDTKVQSETPESITDDLPYRIVEEMGLGLTFRSCTCGQLPCARLRPIRDALEAVRREEREKCAKIAEKHEGHGDWCASAAGDCQSLTVKAIARAIREGR